MHQEIADSLQTTALEIDHAETYAQAIGPYARFRYVLVILELGILDADGVTIVRRLRNLEQTPTLALSTLNSGEEENSALNAGADAYLPIEGLLNQKLCLAYASALMRRYLSANTREIRCNSDCRRWPETQSWNPKSLFEWGKPPPDSETV